MVIDEQRAVLSGVAITLENLDTGDIRAGTSDARGSSASSDWCRDATTMRAVLAPFLEYLQSDLILGLAKKRRSR